MLPVADQFVQHERTLANNVNGPRELDPATATCDLDLSTSYDVSRSQQGHGSINNETVTSSVYKLTSLSERPNQTTPTATSTRGKTTFITLPIKRSLYGPNSRLDKSPPSSVCLA